MCVAGKSGLKYKFNYVGLLPFYFLIWPFNVCPNIPPLHYNHQFHLQLMGCCKQLWLTNIYRDLLSRDQNHLPKKKIFVTRCKLKGATNCVVHFLYSLSNL